MRMLLNNSLRALLFATLSTLHVYSQDIPVPDADRATRSMGAPHITPGDVNETVLSPLRPFVIRPDGCFSIANFHPASPTIAIPDSVPTQKWVIRVPLSSLHQQARLCTLWRVETNFRWVPVAPSPGDTLHIFMREVTPPYNEFYHVRYLVRLGENIGEIEVDPPIPGNFRPLVNNLRDVYLGMYITGGYGNKVTWRVKSPAQYNQSFIFVNPQSPAPASPSSVFGVNGDLMMSATWCFNWYPVEFSRFSGYASAGAVQLEWVTESETNSFQFEVQRRAHGTGETGSEGVWESRGFVASRGSTTSQHHYFFTDPLDDRNAGPYWYRLRQTDYDGTYAYFGPIQISTETPAEGYRLHEAYPNPVTMGESVAIEYDLPAPEAVTVRVYDALGRASDVLIDATMPMGRHIVHWFPSVALPEGTYYIVMKAAGVTQIRTATLLR